MRDAAIHECENHVFVYQLPVCLITPVRRETSTADCILARNLLSVCADRVRICIIQRFKKTAITYCCVHVYCATSISSISLPKPTGLATCIKCKQAMNKAGSSSQSSGKENKNGPEEWPGCKTKTPGELLEKAVPLLIMELHRLEPYYENGATNVQVLNMPNVKIRQVELVGTIRKIIHRTKLDLWIDDGTGNVQIIYNFSNIDEVKDERKRIDSKFSRLEKIATLKNLGPDHMLDLEKRWKQETRNGTLGTGFKVFEYVQVFGKIYVDLGHHNLNKHNLCLDTAKFAKPTIFAKVIYHLSEEEYNNKIQSMITGVVRERYKRD